MFERWNTYPWNSHQDSDYDSLGLPQNPHLLAPVHSRSRTRELACVIYTSDTPRLSQLLLLVPFQGLPATGCGTQAAHGHIDACVKKNVQSIEKNYIRGISTSIEKLRWHSTAGSSFTNTYLRSERFININGAPALKSINVIPKGLPSMPSNQNFLEGQAWTVAKWQQRLSAIGHLPKWQHQQRLANF